MMSKFFYNISRLVNRECYIDILNYRGFSHIYYKCDDKSILHDIKNAFNLDITHYENHEAYEIEGYDVLYFTDRFKKEDILNICNEKKVYLFNNAFSNSRILRCSPKLNFIVNFQIETVYNSNFCQIESKKLINRGDIYTIFFDEQIDLRKKQIKQYLKLIEMNEICNFENDKL